jgi:flagellar biosynthesis component FlhA
MAESKARALPTLTATELGPAIALVGVLAMMVLPVPSWFLDLSLVMSISLALMI